MIDALGLLVPGEGGRGNYGERGKNEGGLAEYK